MRLSPDEMIFWRMDFQTQRHYRLHLGVDAGVDGRLDARHAQSSLGLTRSRWQNLLEIIVTGIAKQIEDVASATPRIPWLSWTLFYCRQRQSCTIIPAMIRRLDRFRPRRRWRYAFSWRCRCSVSRNKGLGNISRLTRSRQSSCCRSTSLANFRDARPAVRLFAHDERGNDSRHFADHHALHFPDRDERARSADGMVQAYIFTILAAVYIAAATRGREPRGEADTTIDA